MLQPLSSVFGASALCAHVIEVAERELTDKQAQENINPVMHRHPREPEHQDFGVQFADLRCLSEKHIGLISGLIHGLCAMCASISWFYTPFSGRSRHLSRQPPSLPASQFNLKTQLQSC